MGVAGGGLERKAAWEARQAAALAAKEHKEEPVKDIDMRSDSAASTAAESQMPLSMPMLTPDEEKEAKKIEKKLRDILKLEKLLAEGARLDHLQMQKLGGRGELEDTLVMKKVRGGYARRSS